MSNRKRLRSTARKLQRHAAREADAAVQMLAIRDQQIASGLAPEVADATLAVFARRRTAGLPLDGPDAEAELQAAIQPVISRLHSPQAPPEDAA